MKSNQLLSSPGDWRGKANFVIIFAIICLIPISGHAGGLANAALLAIGGIGALCLVGLPQIREIPLWVIFLMAFLIWSSLTAFWSPYQDMQPIMNPMKLLIGVWLYFMFRKGLKAALRRNPHLIWHALMATSLIAAGVFIVDLLAGYGLTFAIDPLKGGEDIRAKQGDAEMNLGHGITVLALLLTPVMTIMMRMMKYGWLTAAILALMVLLAGHLCRLAVAEIAVIIGLLAMGLAFVMPRAMMFVAAILGSALLLFAPSVSLLSRVLPETVKSALPFSWEHRVEMWGYVGTRIAEHPFVGHGFDAVRTFNDTFSIRGFDELPLVSLHPHNAGLHIWAETGLVGAILASLTVLCLSYSAYRTARNDTPRLAATVGFMVIAILLCSVSYGVWQEWWWASLIYAGCMLEIVPKREILHKKNMRRVRAVTV